jgi:hypothetical protein
LKLPVSFGNKLFFRVVAPGVVLAIALTRFTQTLLQIYGLKVSFIYVLPAEIIIFGWLCLALDMPIYMLFEGRRFWPSWLLNLGRKRERARLLSLYRSMRRHDITRFHHQFNRRTRMDANRRYLECAFDLNGFPLHPTTAVPNVLWPTRLGNLIAAYEQYPRLKYGMDSVFYWPRLWVAINKDLRDEIDNQQAQADGILYLSAALVAAAGILFAYAIVDTVNPKILMYPQSPAAEVFAGLLCVGSSIALYRISMYSHAQFGELFKAVFDQHRSLLNLDEVIDLVAHITPNTRLHTQIVPIRNMAAWRFLRWHRVRIPGQTINRRVRLP